MRLTLALILAASVAGCSNLQLSNRLSRTVACDEVHITSWWQWFGITVKADAKDAAEMLKACKAA